MKNVICFETNRGKFYSLKNEMNIRMENGLVWDDKEIEILSIPISKSKTILDIGSHIGTHGISYSKINKNAVIHCFEPQKKIFELLLENIKVNDAKNIVPHNEAVGHCCQESELSTVINDDDREDVVEYDVDRKINYGGLGIGSGGEKVNMISIDSLNLKVDYMKIDVEGYEKSVIHGARETIMGNKPVIFYEKIGKDLDFIIDENFNIEKFLFENKYAIKRMGTNILAYPIEKLKMLAVEDFNRINSVGLAE